MGGLAVVALAVMVWVGALVPYGRYVISGPGGTLTLDDRISVEGAEVYASDGEIALVTVSTVYRPRLYEVLLGWLDSSVDVIEAESLLRGSTPEERVQQGRQVMASSEMLAIAVGLEAVGHDALGARGALITEVHEGMAAEGVLVPGDVVVAANGVAVATSGELVAVLRQLSPGDVVELTVLNGQGSASEEPGPSDSAGDGSGDSAGDSSIRTVTVTLGESTDNPGRALLGVSVQTLLEFNDDLGLSVDADVEGLGGPSAGLALTLAVIDALTPGDLTGGLRVVVTGQINASGAVGQVGGVTQKAHAALRSGADLLLVPPGQSHEALAVVDELIEVVEVASLPEALVVLVERGGVLDSSVASGDSA